MILLQLDSNGVVTNRVVSETEIEGYVVEPEFFTTLVGENYYENLALHARDVHLSKSDWTQSPDSPLTAAKKAEWATYRQALRDITDQEGYPQIINWPEQPE